MNRNKHLSGILVASLILSSETAVLSNYNLAEAKRYNGRTIKYDYNSLSNNNSIKVGDIINGKVVKNVVSFSDNDVYEALNKLKSQNLIDILQEKLKEISNLISERGYWGANKIVQFWDEAVDLYLSGIVMDILKTASVDALALVLQYIPYVGTYLNS